MKKARLYTSLDFSELKPDQIQRIVRDLYDVGENEKRNHVIGEQPDRRTGDRRQTSKLVLLDTRAKHSRRRSAGRRQMDENPGNKHKVGIDYYV